MRLVIERVGAQRFTARANNAGGIEGGVSMARKSACAVSEADLHPATAAAVGGLRHPRTCEGCLRTFRRVRGCRPPASRRSHVALTLARCALDKFGGDSLKNET